MNESPKKTLDAKKVDYSYTTNEHHYFRLSDYEVRVKLNYATSLRLPESVIVYRMKGETKYQDLPLIPSIFDGFRTFEHILEICIAFIKYDEDMIRRGYKTIFRNME
jgi:hypothetical protein